ncbi:hypothetical protein [Sorangium atrum]|uniref:Uncharacterized protein n=1 Tax=Sorangium atrum TaxID=2995308 RepID=A0ABT5BZ15_9BACT|nr:hypothetical protein [Sorangium aterium]MDC0679395.1 hypothetical protein [Sorangium aterium]
MVTLEDVCSSREVERLDGGSSVVAERDRGSSESSASQRVQRGLNGEFSALHPGQMITLSPRLTGRCVACRVAACGPCVTLSRVVGYFD